MEDTRNSSFSKDRRLAFNDKAVYVNKYISIKHFRAFLSLNDRLTSSTSIYSVGFVFMKAWKPLDLSGAYSVRQIHTNVTLYFTVEGFIFYSRASISATG